MLISLRVWQALRSSDTPHRRDFLPAFTRNQVTKPFPAWRRFMVAQLLNTLLPVVDWSSLCNGSGRAIGSKGGVAPPSAQRSAASPITGTALQRLLG